MADKDESDLITVSNKSDRFFTNHIVKKSKADTKVKNLMTVE